MANDFYTPTGWPGTSSFGTSADARAEMNAIEDAFDKLIDLSSNANKLVKVNAGGTAEAASIITDDGSTATIGGALTVTGAITFTSGAINGIAIGGGTPAAGSFTNLTVTGNTILGDAAIDTVEINAADWTLTQSPTVTGTWANLGSVTTVDINGGTIDAAVIGGATPAAGAFTTLSSSGAATLASATVSGTTTLTGAVSVGSTVDGRDLAADGSKLDGIESGATADQTGAEIKSLYEAEANAFTDAQFTKLAGIEAAADVTDATNVDAAGATMNTDADVSGNSWVLDEDDFASNSATKVPTQQSVAAYVAANGVGFTVGAGFPGTPSDGEGRFNTTTEKAYLYDATAGAWIEITAGGIGSGGSGSPLQTIAFSRVY